MSVVTTAIGKINPDGKQFLLGCSGGIDSMVLLDALVKAGIRPVVLHVNYQLREEDSEQDQQLVEETAMRLGLEVRVYRCPTAITKGEGINLQNAARNFRRERFQEWLQQSEHHYVVLAHHADDQVETFFLQWMRGGGTFGLGGMHLEKGRILRPLLDVTRSEITQYAGLHHIQWREDRSNAGNHYLRNWLRNTWLPEITQQQPDLNEQVRYLMHLFREKQYELERKVQSAADTWRTNGKLAIETWEAWDETLRLAFVRALDWPVWVKDRLNGLVHAASGSRVEVHGTVIWKGNNGYLMKASESATETWDFKIEEVGFLPDKWDKSAIYLDPERIDGTLEMRNWETGDRIRSLGIAGSQLVSDVLKDARIPLQDRVRIQVLKDSGRILWIPGIKISRDALADAESVVIWKVTCESRLRED